MSGMGADVVGMRRLQPPFLHGHDQYTLACSMHTACTRIFIPSSTLHACEMVGAGAQVCVTRSPLAHTSRLGAGAFTAMAQHHALPVGCGSLSPGLHDGPAACHQHLHAGVARCACRSERRSNATARSTHQHGACSPQAATGHAQHGHQVVSKPGTEASPFCATTPALVDGLGHADM